MTDLTTNLRIVPASIPKPPPPAEIQGELFDEIVLAERLGISRSTLQSWRYAGRGPRYLKIGRLIRYRNADIETFLRASACGDAS